MFTRSLHALVRRYSLWLTVQAALGAGLLALTVVLALELARRIRPSGEPAGTVATGEFLSADQWLERLSARESVTNRIAAAMRPGLFKSATPLRDKPMADKTIEKILSQLKLQCILPINGEVVAYVNVENSGLKKCRVGDSVEDARKMPAPARVRGARCGTGRLPGGTAGRAAGKAVNLPA